MNHSERIANTIILTLTVPDDPTPQNIKYHCGGDPIENTEEALDIVASLYQSSVITAIKSLGLETALEYLNFLHENITESAKKLKNKPIKENNQ